MHFCTYSMTLFIRKSSLFTLDAKYLKSQLAWSGQKKMAWSGLSSCCRPDLSTGIVATFLKMYIEVGILGST